MSGSETTTQWFIARDGKQHGPISDIEIRKLVELAHLKPSDLVWRQGFSDWRSAGSVFPLPATAAADPAPGAQPQAQPAPAQAPSAGAPPSSGSPATGPHGRPPGPGGPHQPITSLAPAPQPGARSGAPGEARTEPAARPLATPITPGGPMPGPGGSAPQPQGKGTLPSPAGQGGPGQAPRPAADARRPIPEMTVPARAGAAPGKFRPTYTRKALIAAGLLVMTGAGAWLSSQYKDQILTYVRVPEEADEKSAAADKLPDGDGQSATATANVVPTATPVANVVPQTGDLDQKLQARGMWVAVKEQFPERYQEIVSQASRLVAEQKPQTEITTYLVAEIVKIRRENAQHALAASTARHKDVAATFLANLKELSRESGDGCYEFISRGETSAVILSRIDDPARSVEIEAQVLAVLKAIVEGRAQPSTHPAPVKTDYDVLAGELGRLGWTQADMQLFANPRELAKAPRDRVCSMLKDWFTAHLAIEDPSTQERLLFETLKPVVSG